MNKFFAAIGVAGSAPPRQRNPRTEPKDVFEAIVQAVRQVNLMIDEPLRTADVYDQLSITSVYLAGVLARTGDEMFPQAEFAPNKQPIDVYAKLVDCLVANQRIGEALGVPVLRVRARDLKRERSILSDNYDIATMIVSDTAYWTEYLPYDEDVFPPAESLKHIFPSHVLAKAGSVEMQLKAISDRIASGTIAARAAP